VAAEVLANEPQNDPQDAGHMCHGGPFASVALGNSGLAGMNVIQDAKETE
jgi:uronate dehydrogenase